jgi:hypothetical protein
MMGPDGGGRRGLRNSWPPMDPNELSYAAATVILIAMAVLAWRRWGPKPDEARPRTSSRPSRPVSA